MNRRLNSIFTTRFWKKAVHYTWSRYDDSWIMKRLPDERFLRLATFLLLGRRLNLDDPVTFSDKLQWLKLHDRQSIYTILVDKHLVKDWVASRIGSSYVIPTLGHWSTPEEIDYGSLPDQFVLKANHDSGGLVICKDRTSLDVTATNEVLTASLARNYFEFGREWPYLNVPRLVLAEKYVIPESDFERKHGLIDYKFYCFNGEPKFLYVSVGLHDQKTAMMRFLYLDWTPMPFTRPDYMEFLSPPKPRHLDLMLSLASRLSEGIPFARVDFYDRESGPLFSEITLHPVSGWMPVDPPEWDLKLGTFLELPTVQETPAERDIV